MKISVVTAAYNSQATIASTIKSFLSQTHPDKEMLVIDGASNDDTLKIVNRSALVRSGSCRKKTRASSMP